MRRAFSLAELLVVVAILGVLAAVLFPVFARSKERAKLTSCASRLRQFAVALNLYRADHDGLGYVYPLRDDGMNFLRAPFNHYEGMRAYLGDGTVVWCPEPPALDEALYGLKTMYFYRVFPERRQGLSGVRLHVPFRPVPGTVVAYCENHTGIAFDPRFDLHGEIRAGNYPFVREDTSMGVARSEALSVVYYDFDAQTWCGSSHARCGHIERFPGEPWPPEPEQ